MSDAKQWLRDAAQRIAEHNDGTWCSKSWRIIADAFELVGDDPDGKLDLVAVMFDEIGSLTARLAAAEARINRSEFSVRLQTQRLYGQGFAAYVNGSASDGTAVIVADLHAILESCVDSGETWKRVTSESCVHELLHAFEEVLGREFNDREVEAAIEAARAAGGCDD